MQIWVLFSIENDYNQPNNNMVAWWSTKPTFDVFKKIVSGGCIMKDEKVGMIYRGIERQIETGGTTYRFQEVEEGKRLK